MESTLQMYVPSHKQYMALLQTVCEVLDHQLCTDIGHIAAAHTYTSYREMQIQEGPYICMPVCSWVHA